MARKLRILFDGAYYHVINRGQAKQKIFLSKNDFGIFLNIIKNACKTCKVNIVAFCLMKNHYHLLVHTPHANLSDFMRQVNGVYTQVFNQRYKRDGALFKGRYKAVVVQEGSFLLRLVRYIHNNPVKAGIIKKCSDYLYSSNAAYMKGKETEWLKFISILRTLWKEESDFRKAYRNFMSKDDQEFSGYLGDKSRKASAAIIVGDAKYIDDIKTNYLHRTFKERDIDEIPEGKSIKHEMMTDTIKKEVALAFSIEEKELFSSQRGKENLARMMAIGLCRWCGGMSYKYIAKQFGDIHYKSAAKYYERITMRCKNDKAAAKLFDDLSKRCSQVET
ncbi:MAG: transposase [bacterium]